MDTLPSTREADRSVAAVAHELRNAIGPLGNALDILGAERASPEVVRRALPVARRQLDFITRLVNDLVEAGSMVDGSVRLIPLRACLQDLVEEATESFRYVCARRHQELTTELPAEPLWVRVDPGRIAQVLYNLIGNAAKFTSPGGHIHIQLQARGHEGVLTIADDGVGIAPAGLERIFGLFQQEAASRHLSRGGVGMGLALSRRLVELHGGTLTAASAGRGRGATFTLRLPLL